MERDQQKSELRAITQMDGLQLAVCANLDGPRPAAHDSGVAAPTQVSPNAWLVRLDAQQRDALALRRQTAQALAERLFAEFGAQRVFLFGSTARGETGGRGDLDLATIGLPERSELAAQGALLMDTDVAVDLVRLETASSRLRANIERDGIELFRPAAGGTGPRESNGT